MNFTRDELAGVTILEGLPDEVLDWFGAHGERIEAPQGTRLFERGDEADSLWMVIQGSLQGFEEIGGQWLLAATTPAGDVTGMLPFSRMKRYPRYVLAPEPTVVLRLRAALFPELLDLSHEMGQRLVARMSDRVRGDVRLEQQGAKMMALGRLSAGLAHELNNPAAALRRAAARLKEHRTRLPRLVTALVRHSVGREGLEKLEALRETGREARAPGGLGLDRSEAEDALLDWLEAHGVPDAWDVAGTLADGGVGTADLDTVAGLLPAEAVADAIAWLGGGIESDRIVEEISGASERISELVTSIKTYSHMDRSGEHRPTDVREGLDNTLTMLGHKIRAKSLRLERRYAEDVPTVPGNAGELNQVWTNLIDNAIDAAPESGSLLVGVARSDAWVTVSVADDGPGIPDDVRSRIFEPFFTTKAVGVGTGLGLGIAMRIIRLHRGDIEVRTRPGETVMTVRLPVGGDTPVP